MGVSAPTGSGPTVTESRKDHMENLHNTQPATDAGTRIGHVAVCDNGDLLPLSSEQFRDNFLESGPTLKTQLGRDDIAFVCSEQFAHRWPTRESIVEHVAKHRIWIAQREANLILDDFDSSS